MELQVLDHCFSFVPDGHTVEAQENLADLGLLVRVFNVDAWPSDPNRLHDWMALLQVEKMVVQDALRGFHKVLACLFADLQDDWKFKGHHDQFLLVYVLHRSFDLTGQACSGRHRTLVMSLLELWRLISVLSDSGRCRHLLRMPRRRLLLECAINRLLFSLHGHCGSSLFSCVLNWCCATDKLLGRWGCQSRLLPRRL